MGIEGVVVEGALLTALEVVSLLVRHEPLDGACLRRGALYKFCGGGAGCNFFFCFAF